MAQLQPRLHGSRGSALGGARRPAQKPLVRFSRSLGPAPLCKHGEPGSSERGATQGAVQSRAARREPPRRWGLPSLQLSPEQSPKTLLLSIASAFLASGVMGGWLCPWVAALAATAQTP